jgi:hypothetical protein
MCQLRVCELFLECRVATIEKEEANISQRMSDCQASMPSLTPKLEPRSEGLRERSEGQVAQS